jgi:hypothetical protein
MEIKGTGTEAIESIIKGVIYSYPFISIIGSIANIIAFVIFSSKRFQNTSFVVYFQFLIIFDTIPLIFPINKVFEWNFNIHIEDFSQMSCRVKNYFENALFPLSGWITSVISLDRMLSIIYPTKFVFRKKSSCQILICLVILTFNLLYYCPILLFSEYYKLILYDNQTNITNLTIICSFESVHLELLDFFQADLIPFALMITFTQITLNSIFKSRKASNLNNKNKSTRNRDLKFALTSIGLNMIYLLLNSPSLVINIVLHYFTSDEITYDLFGIAWCIGLFLFYLNRIPVFFVNIVANSIFRNEFLTLILKRKNLNRSDRSIITRGSIFVQH